MGDMDSAQLDVEFDQMLVSLKPYVIKIQQQSGWLMYYLCTQSFFVEIEISYTQSFFVEIEIS